MKTKLKLGIVFGMLLIMAACQKEEIAVIDNQENDVNHEEVGSYEAVNDNLTTTDENTDVTSIIPIFYTGIDDLRQVTNDVVPPTGIVPSNAVLDAINDSMNNDKVFKPATITWTDKYPTDNKWTFIDTSIEPSAEKAKGPGPSCSYEDCDIAIPAIVAQYQDLANQMCQDLHVCIPCCIDNFVVYAMVIIHHQCGIIPDTDWSEY